MTTTRKCRSWQVLLRVSGSFAVLLALFAVQEAAAASVESLLVKAARRADKHDYPAAAQLYSKADRKAGGSSVAALAGLSRANLAMGRYREAIAAAERWREQADTPDSEATARFVTGEAHYWLGVSEVWQLAADGFAGRAPSGGERRPGRDELERAAAAFEAGLQGTDNPALRAPALLLLADARIEIGAFEAAEQALDAYGQAGGANPFADNLRCWIAEAPRPLPAPQGDSTPPRKIYGPHPQYTRQARAARVEGTMLLELVVTDQGDVRCLRARRGLPFGMVQSATSAILEWRFVPRMVAGQPVPTRYLLSIDFRLK